MSIWAVADLHASRLNPATGLPEKPMDVFGPRWENHMERLETAWKDLVGPDDTVIIAGDIDWALHLRNAMETLERIDTWKGQKILIRGNHDYWWSSKTTNKVRSALPPSIRLLHNNAFQVEGFNICGAKGSPVPGGIDWTAENAKLLNREVLRLEMSLDQRDTSLPTIVALHYPPFYPNHPDTPYRHLIEEAGAEVCVYGHLHADSARAGPSGCYGRTRYCLVAGDYVKFRPVLLSRDGRIVSDPGNKLKGREMPEQEDDLGGLAEKLMSDKRDELGNEDQARELYDVPTETTEELAEQQKAEEQA